MTTYGTMQTRIGTELVRSDLSSEIQSAIQSAIRYYERTLFYFNEAIATSTTVDGQRYYALPSDFVEMESIKVTLPGSSYQNLLPRTFRELEEMDLESSGHEGYPDFYSLFGEQFRLYPVPNGSYTLTLAYIRELPSLSVSSDSNAWMTDAEALIRYRAKWDLYLNVIHEKELADAMKEAEREEFMSLRNRTTNTNSTGRIRPTYF